MPLDFELIQNSVAYSKNKLKSRTITESSEVFLLEDFFNPSLIEKLYQYVTSTNITWKKVPGQENRTRQEVNWVFDSVIEEVHSVVEQLTDDINDIFNRKLKFNGISIWKDSPSYCYGRHKDVDIINIALQIYLTSGYKELNTKFYYKNQVLESTYEYNHGYLMDNANKLEHGIETPVPEGHVRWSIYASWDLYGK
jgi:hypothetical protein